ncbi:MAG: hypothetical protein V3R49_06760 [Gammaproteobacteria bacterium]
MDAKNNNILFSRKWKSSFLVLILVGLYSCAQLPEAQQITLEPQAEGSAVNSSKVVDAELDVSADSSKIEAPPETAAAIAEQADISVGNMKVTLVTIGEPAAAESAEAIPSRIVESCNGETYRKYEKQARTSIAKGLDATKAGKYGVGFRDLKEHKRWSSIHKKLFQKVSKACGALSKCAKQHPKEKSTRCATQATVFDEWQAMSKRFAGKAKMVETTQPDKICSFEPNLNDAPQCFHGLGDNVDKVCNSPECKEVADCWRGIGFLDLAIKQATTACGFVFKKLADCRGYTEATNRRVKKFEQCKNMQGSLNIVKFPSL